MILQDYVPARATIGETTNRVLFGLHILVIAQVMYLTILQFVRQSIEAKRREAKQLKVLDAMKTRFYTGITHEFRTPLTVILGMARQIQKDPAAFARQGASMIRDSGNRLLYLVNQMLDLSKMESGVMEYRPVQADVVPFLVTIIEPFRWMAEECDIHLSISMPEKPARMDFDPDKLESLLANLVSNAIKYAPEGTEVGVVVKLTDALPETGTWGFRLFTDDTVQDSKSYLCIMVIDQGPGIPETSFPLIFERYRKLDTSTAHQAEGTGIGLALVKEIVPLMGGKLYLSSSPGKGSRFEIYLPIQRNAEVQGEAFARSRPENNGKDGEQGGFDATWVPGKKKNLILVIEDNENVRTYITSILSPEYRVEMAADGEEGIERAFDNMPDLVLTDVMMPRKDGFEVCAALKQDFRTSHIPIIMLTARADMDSRIEGLDHGADDYLVKPFNENELTARIRNLLISREQLRKKYQLSGGGDIPVNPENPDEVFFAEFRRTLKENLDNEQFDTRDLAHQLHMSRTQLFRKLKALTGQSASQLIRSYRLTTARKLLETTHMNISEIGYAVGYRDPAYFSKAFTREFGLTPSEYRQSAGQAS